jgi:ribosomal protein L11 methyltransferase
MNYHQITVHTVTEAVEAISNAFMDLGAGGVEIFDPKDILNQEKDPTSWDYIDEDLLADLNREEVLMRCYFSETILPDRTALEDLLLKISDRLQEIAQYLPIGSGKIETKLMAEETWADAWKKYYKPFRLGEHILIVPSWIDEEPQAGDICITLDPGMAFGTGTHETTSMCITMLEQQVRPGQTVLDIGCGSGILGIVAAKLNANKVIESDLDPNAVMVAKENAELNGVQNVLEIHQGDLTKIPALQGVQADGIVANIIADVIIQLAPQARDFLKDGGYFITSGIIRERKDDVVRALQEAGYRIEEIQEKGSWVAIRSTKQ